MSKRHADTTACTWDCPDACSLILEGSRDKAKVRGNPEHPVTQGVACGKIQRHLKRLASPQRLRAPLRKTRNGWKELSWEEALDLCADRLGPVLEEDPRALLHIQGQGARGIVKSVVERFFSSLGCTRTQGSLCDETGIQASILDFGSLEHNAIHDLLQAKHIVNWGKDLQRSAMHLGQIVGRARKQGTRHLVIWPGGKGYERLAEEAIRIRPGTDRFLALAVLQELLELGGSFGSRLERCANSREFWNILQQWSLPELASRCDVSQETIRGLAEIYAEERVSTLIGWGVQRHPCGGEAVRLINALSWLSGNVGRPGSGVYFNLSSQRFFNLSWLPEPSNRSLNLPRIGREMEAAKNPAIRAAWLNGTNIVNQAPESRRLANVFSGLDFMVVVDAFLTDSAACADLVLPCTLMWEEEDVVGSCMHDCLQLASGVFSPPPGVRSDYWIAEELGRRLGSGFRFPSRDYCFRQTLGPPWPDIDVDQLRERGFVRIQRDPVVFSGPKTAHQDGLFHLLHCLSPEPEPDPGYPLTLLSLIRNEAIHSQLLPEEHQIPPPVAVNPKASGMSRIDLDRPVSLVSPLGRLEVDLILDSSLHPEAVIYRRGDWMRLGGGVNQLIEARLTDLGVGAAYYGQRVRLENE